MTFKVGDKVRLTAKGVEYVETYVCSEDAERWNADIEGVIESDGLFVNVRLPVRFEHAEDDRDADVWPLQITDIELIES